MKKSLETRVSRLETESGIGTSVENAVLERSLRTKQENAALKAWRERHGYSIAEAAKALGVEHDPERQYAPGQYMSMESGAHMTNAVRAVIGIKPIEPWDAEDYIRVMNKTRKWKYERLGIEVKLLSEEEEASARTTWAEAKRAYDAAMKVYEANNTKEDTNAKRSK